METKMSIGVGLSVILLIFGAVFFWGSAGNVATSASVQGVATTTADTKSALAATETFYDFGTISMKNGDVTKEFTVTNSTSKDIFVPTLVTSCMCTTAFIVEPNGSVKGPFKMPAMGYVPPANELIKAGESRTIRVVYDPNAHGPAGVGNIDRFAILTDAAGGQIQFEIKALVTP